MSFVSEASPENETEIDQDQPLVKSLQNLTMIESWNDGKLKSTTFYHVTDDEEVFFGYASKNKREMTMPEFNSSLKRVQDQDIYSKISVNIHLTLASEVLDPSLVYVKRSGLQWYDDMIGTNHLSKAILDDTLVMEQISRAPHPNIIQYYGCRVRRGFNTSIVLERLDQTLSAYVSTSDFQKLDKIKFFEYFKSAVENLHSLRLAHNDINPDNLMVKNGSPVLIDFDSCQPSILGKS
ncbi:hypothetical protein PENCOP_c003G02733 [Penicillium coprophilum]|uniref:Protein kinase domain-containing protein n=1 Tax=Penicillium coprophilum TaxID=36646 RepID=A0A1V6UZ05_9EURO|nr:hypothetical protein PENCOP_c003G02733 [Penicillium coprophilum]